jgi:hypothetical protein
MSAFERWSGPGDDGVTDRVRDRVDALRHRYALECELGRGGMATVWLARDLKHDRLAWLPAECRFGFVSMSGDARVVACAVLHQELDICLVSNFDGGP